MVSCFHWESHVSLITNVNKTNEARSPKGDGAKIGKTKINGIGKI